MNQQHIHPSPDPGRDRKQTSAGRGAIAAVALCMATANVADGSARAEDNCAVEDRVQALQADDALLAPYGFSRATIAESVDVPALWRAVRDLALTDRVTIETQQAMLRRAWAVDKSIHLNDAVEAYDPGAGPDGQPPIVRLEQAYTGAP